MNALTPNDVIQMYAILAPIFLALAFALYVTTEKPKVIVNFPKLLLCGQVDDIGTTVHIAGQKNGALIIAGRKLKPNSQVYLIEVGNG